MIASRHFNITRANDDDWFDAILNSDTKLFIDPFLIFREKTGFWSTAHRDIIKHFDRAFLLVAQSNFRSDSLPYRKAVNILEFPEAHELCLGYTAKGTKGAGGGEGYAETIAAAIADAIKRGLEHPKHFEELGILNKGIGRDRISDITATILKPYFIRYTTDIAARHGIPLHKHRLKASTFAEDRVRWEHGDVEVPTNSYGASPKPFLFVPQRFVRELPTLNADDWWSSYEDARHRADLNYDIMGKVDKDVIVEAARQHPELVRKWMEEKEAQPPEPYDVAKDRLGVYQWDSAAEQFASQHPMQLAPATSGASFSDVIQRVVDQFAHFVEEQGGWALLWNDDQTEKPEEAIQLLFRGIVFHYCRASNIVVDREVELGRGPVDFKFSNGYTQRAHLEIKKLHNGKFWNGLSDQLPTYMRADDLRDGWFVAVRYRTSKAARLRVRELPETVRRVSQEKGIDLRFKAIDARRPISASKIDTLPKRPRVGPRPRVVPRPRRTGNR
jgi:hypothetical protein